jgi:hypothetical protein
MTGEHIQTDQMRNRIAIFLIGAFVGALIALTFKEMPEKNKDILIYMVGQLSGMAGTVLTFYFTNKVGQDAIDAKRIETTGKLVDAVVAGNETTKTAAEGARRAAGAASDEATAIEARAAT